MNTSSYQVKQNFIEKEKFNFLQKTLFGDFPWFYREKILSNKKNNDSFYFAHMFARHNEPTSTAFELLKPILQKLNVKYILEIRANLVMKTKTKTFSGFHIDIEESPIKTQKTAIFYLNNNNGYTVLDPKKKIKIKSKANQMLTFDSDVKHGAVLQTDKKRRIVINFNYN